jgi:hypothetical protein
MATSSITWKFYPQNVAPADWVEPFVAAVRAVESDVGTVVKQGPDSDGVLRLMRPHIEPLGYQVETGKKKAEKIVRPVLYGENGVIDVPYNIDAWHQESGVVVEVEAGRGVMSNAAYRDIFRTSLILDAAYLALLMPLRYRYKSSGKELITNGYSDSRNILDALYASRRLVLPFEGVLLVGY